MAEVIIKNRDGEDLTFSGVKAVKLNTTDGGTQIFSEGVAMEGVEIEPDFSAGDQNVIAADGYLVKSAVIKKPDTLLPKNIVEGVEIAGVTGTAKGGDYIITYMNEDGSKTLYKKAIMHGDTAGDVVALGLMGEPEKEPAETEIHIFLGWSSSIGGEVDSSALENVTEDRIVYAVFESIAIVASGECGENAIWRLTGNGVLIVSGNGAMPDYASQSERPWHDYIGDIKSVVIEDGITSIGKNAFRNCASLTNITIPDSLTSIGYYAFGGCTALTSVTFGVGLTSIDITAFIGCSELTSMTVAAGHPLYYSVGNCLIETATGILVLGCSGSIIPNDGSVTSIGVGAFTGCTGLTSITIPNSVIAISAQAFNGCSALKSVTIQDGVTSIGDRAFQSCAALTSITIPSSVTSIGWYCFNFANALTSVTFKTTKGWWVSTSSTATSGTSVTVTSASTAANYLKGTYLSYYWKRS